MGHVLADMACIQCKGRARLLATNVELSTLLASTRPYPLEGSGLDVLLNPVMIDGRRAWADFTSGGFAVFREHRRSGDWFDFVVQHVEPGPRVLDSMRELGRHMQSPSGMMMSLMQRFAAGGEPGSDPLERLGTWWQLARAGALAATAAGPIRTNADAWAAADALANLDRPLTVSAADTTEMVQRLWELSSAT